MQIQNSRRETAILGLWLASLFVPGWAQIAMERKLGFAWLALALAVWALFGWSALLAFGNRQSALGIAITAPVILCVHVASCASAFRLIRQLALGNRQSRHA